MCTLQGAKVLLFESSCLQQTHLLITRLKSYRQYGWMCKAYSVCFNIQNVKKKLITVAGEQDYDPITLFNSPLLDPFNDGTRSQCFDVSIIDDDLLEQTESFTLMVTPDDVTAPVRISPNVSIINIMDNDSKPHT